MSTRLQRPIQYRVQCSASSVFFSSRVLLDSGTFGPSQEVSRFGGYMAPASAPQTSATGIPKVLIRGSHSQPFLRYRALFSSTHGCTTGT